MKKVIAIAVVVVIALVGLTSYNGRTEVKKSGDDNLIASVKTGGENTILDPRGGDKKKLD